MISAETVAVIETATAYDDLGEPTDGGTTETEVHVIVAPGSTADLDATRPNGATVAYTLHFPKTWTASLRGLQVRVRGQLYSVIGDPQPYTAANTPGAYWLPVEVTRADG